MEGHEDNILQSSSPSDIQSTGFQLNGSSIITQEPLNQSSVNHSLVSSLKKIIKWSRPKESFQGPISNLVPLEREDKDPQLDEPINSHHHHPGDKPGKDAEKMIEDSEEDKGVDHQSTIEIESNGNMPKKNETRTISGVPITGRRTGKRVNGRRSYLDSPRRETAFRDFEFLKHVPTSQCLPKPGDFTLFYLVQSQCLRWVSFFRTPQISPEKSTQFSSSIIENPAMEDLKPAEPEDLEGNEDLNIQTMDISSAQFDHEKDKSSKMKRTPTAPHQKFESITKDKRKSGKKGVGGIVRSENVYAVPTKESKRDRKWRERQERNKRQKDEEERKRLAEANKKNSKLQIMGERFTELLIQLQVLYRRFQEGNSLASRFRMHTESNEELDESAFAATERSVAEKRFVETIFAVRKARKETRSRLNKLFRSIVGGLFVPFPDEIIYTAQDLRRAAVFGRYESVVDILDHWSSVTPNDRCMEGDTPYYAVVMKCLEGISEEDETYTIEFGFMAFWKKIQTLFSQRKRKQGNLFLVMNIFDYSGGDINVVKEDRDGGDGVTLLHQAARRNLVQLAKWLHSRDVDVHKPSTKLQLTPLMFAALAGNNEMIVRLLHMGAIDTINTQELNGNTALHFAAVHCDPEYIQYLLLCGANKSIRNSSNRLPIEEARVKGKHENMAAISAYHERSHIRRPQIEYYADEVKKGRTGALEQKIANPTSSTVETMVMNARDALQSFSLKANAITSALATREKKKT